MCVDAARASDYWMLRRISKSLVPFITVGDSSTFHSSSSLTLKVSCETISNRRFMGFTQVQSLQWMISFSYAEKMLTFHGEKTSWKPVMKTLKRVVEIVKGVEGLSHTGKSLQVQRAAQHIKSKYFQKEKLKLSLTTYHIRTLMWTLLYAPVGWEEGEQTLLLPGKPAPDADGGKGSCSFLPGTPDPRSSHKHNVKMLKMQPW